MRRDEMDSLSPLMTHFPTSPLQIRSDALLLCHPSMETLAEAIAERCSGTLGFLSASAESKDTRNPRGRSGSKVCQKIDVRKAIKWEKFADGWPNLFIDKVKEVAGKDVIFLGSFHSPTLVFEQLSVLYAIPRYLARSFTLILPYFPTGTMERVDTEGQIATAKTLATLLSAIPLTARGPAQIVVFDIHALQERFYFSDNVIPRLETAVPLLHRELSKFPEDAKISIAFPDEGAYKRFHMFFDDKYEAITCVKIRDNMKRKVIIKDGDPKGYHVVIVDDLIQTGGTLRNCAQALYDRGAVEVSAFVTHPVFPDNSWEVFTDSSSIKFSNFWITDSVPHATEIAQHSPFKLVSLCDIISNTLLGFDLLQ